MPTYEYACTACGHHLEAVQSFSDEPLTTCPHCGGQLRKVFGSVGIVLKGSGFYRTDSRSSNGKATATKAKDRESSGTSAADTTPVGANTSSGSSSADGSSGSSGTSGSSGSSDGASSSSPSPKAPAAAR